MSDYVAYLDPEIISWVTSDLLPMVGGGFALGVTCWLVGYFVRWVSSLFEGR